MYTGNLPATLNRTTRANAPERHENRKKESHPYPQSRSILARICSSLLVPRSPCRPFQPRKRGMVSFSLWGMLPALPSSLPMPSFPQSLQRRLLAYLVTKAVGPFLKGGLDPHVVEADLARGEVRIGRLELDEQVSRASEWRRGCELGSRRSGAKDGWSGWGSTGRTTWRSGSSTDHRRARRRSTRSCCPCPALRSSTARSARSPPRSPGHSRSSRPSHSS